MSESVIENSPKNPAAPREKRKGPVKPTAQLPGAQGFQPSQPTDGADLVAMWDLKDPRAYREGRLKVSRRVHPTLELELLAEMVIGEYNLGGLARDFGPGQLFLSLSADPRGLWGVHSAKVTVSSQYAAAQGYQMYSPSNLPATYPPPLPRISDANALQAAASALGTDRPLTVRDLAQLMEMMADRTAEAISRRTAPQLQGDPMAFFGACLTMQQTMEDRAFKVAERLMTGRSDPVEPAEPSFAGEMMKLLPTLLAAFKRPDTPQQVQNPGPPDHPGRPTEPPPQEPPMVDQAPPIEIPLTQEEAERFRLAVGMLRPWAAAIVQALDAEPDVLKVAQDFERYCPPALEGQLTDLNRLTQERGCAVLALISPELATPRGADLVAKIVTIISQE